MTKFEMMLEVGSALADLDRCLELTAKGLTGESPYDPRHAVAVSAHAQVVHLRLQAILQAKATSLLEEKVVLLKLQGDSLVDLGFDGTTLVVRDLFGQDRRGSMAAWRVQHLGDVLRAVRAWLGQYGPELKGLENATPTDGLSKQAHAELWAALSEYLEDRSRCHTAT